jgi:DNA-binding transcriptional MocR family regulator
LAAPQDHQERTYYIASMSKFVAPGLRIAYVAGPPGGRQSLRGAISATSMMASPITAGIASAWIENGSALRILEARRTEARARQNVARSVLRPFAYRSTPASYHGWLELTPAWRTDEFLDELGRRNVAVTPAESFAIGDAVAPRAVRICLGGVRDRGVLETGLRAISEVLSGAPRSVSAIL